MKIYIMRHGEAEPHRLEDALRNLTPRGEQETRAAGDWLFTQSRHIDLALVSPYNRAQQSFAQVAGCVTINMTETCDDITPGGDSAFVHSYLQSLLATYTQVKSLLLVSHMPLVSFLVDELCQQPLSLLFATSGIVRLDYDLSRQRGVMRSQYLP